MAGKAGVVSQISIYPLKGARAIDLTHGAARARGLVHDRRFIATDADGGFLTQRNCPALATLDVTLTADGVRLSREGAGAIDAAEFVGPYDDVNLGLNQLGSDVFYNYPGWWEPGPSLEVQFPLSWYNDLPEQYQAAIQAASRVRQSGRAAARNWTHRRRSKSRCRGVILASAERLALTNRDQTLPARAVFRAQNPAHFRKSIRVIRTGRFQRNRQHAVFKRSALLSSRFDQTFDFRKKDKVAQIGWRRLIAKIDSNRQCFGLRIETGVCRRVCGRAPEAFVDQSSLRASRRAFRHRQAQCEGALLGNADFLTDEPRRLDCNIDVAANFCVAIKTNGHKKNRIAMMAEIGERADKNSLR